MANARSIEVKVGILILSALGLLAGFVVVMGGINFQPTYALFVKFDNPGGLQTGAPVKIAGVKVGKIEKIDFRGASQNKAGKREKLVRIELAIEKRYQKAIHDNATLYVTTQGVLGEQFLAIEPGSDDRPVIAANAELEGLDPPRLDMLLAEGYELLHSTVSALRENRPQLGEAFDGLRKTLKGTGDFFDKNANRLDTITANVEQITVTADGTLKAARTKYVDNPQIDRILGNVDSATGTVARDAPPLIADAKETLANTKRLSATLGAESEQARIKQTLADVSDIAKSAKVTLADTQSIVSHIKKGKGSVGALVMDEQLYDDLQELARDLKHNPWKFLWRE